MQVRIDDFRFSIDAGVTDLAAAQQPARAQRRTAGRVRTIELSTEHWALARSEAERLGCWVARLFAFSRHRR